MADVLHVHTRRTGIRSMAIHCECGWSESILGMRSSKKAFAAHQAEALAAAGFGPAKDARAEAWDECEAATYEIRLDPTGKFWEPYKVNPYR